MGGNQALRILVAVTAGALVLCSPLLAAPPAPRSAATPAARGLAFAQAHCSGCHAVAPGQFSRNSEAPPFEHVVNKEGLTAETLTYWLRHSHNFPEVMNFDVDDKQVDALAAYMLTLKERPVRPGGRGKDRRP